jgi:hypothetical protein
VYQQAGKFSTSELHRAQSVNRDINTVGTSIYTLSTSKGVLGHVWITFSDRHQQPVAHLSGSKHNRVMIMQHHL